MQHLLSVSRQAYQPNVTEVTKPIGLLSLTGNVFRPDPLRPLWDVLDPQSALKTLLRQALRYGGVVGWKRGGEEVVVATPGLVRDGVFELASLSKSVTAALVAELVRAGRLEWQAPLSALDGPFRDWAGEITPLALATHTAGLPAHPLRAAVTALTRYHDPYGNMSAADALASARRWHSVAQSGRFLYSNLGAGVLGLAAAYAAGYEISVAEYGAAVREWVAAPLGLSDLTLQPHPARLVPPTGTLLGEGVTGFGPLAAAGGWYGTAGDLLAFALAQSGNSRPTLTPPGLPPGIDAVAPGWFETAGVWWSAGLARGTRTALALSAQTGTVAVVLARGGQPKWGARDNVRESALALVN